MSSSEHLKFQDVLKFDILFPYELEWNHGLAGQEDILCCNKKRTFHPLFPALHHLPYAGCSSAGAAVCPCCATKASLGFRQEPVRWDRDKRDSAALGLCTATAAFGVSALSWLQQQSCHNLYPCSCGLGEVSFSHPSAVLKQNLFSNLLWNNWKCGILGELLIFQ